MDNLSEYNCEIRRLNKLLSSKNKKFNLFNKNTKFSLESHLESQHFSGEIIELEHWITHLQTERLNYICTKRHLAMPNTSDKAFYYEHNFDDEYGERNILTPEGIELVSKKIREERQFRITVVSFYFTLASGIVGLIMGIISFYNIIVN